MFVIFLSSKGTHDYEPESYGYWSGKSYTVQSAEYPVCDVSLCARTKKYTSRSRAENAVQKLVDRFGYVKRGYIEEAGKERTEVCIMKAESTPLAPYDEREVSDKQKIYNRFKYINDPPQFSIAEIKEIRATLGLSQPMLAQILGVAPRTAEAWEAGKKNPNGSARRLLQILKTDTDVIRRAGIAEW